MQRKTQLVLFLGFFVFLSLSCNTAFLSATISTPEEMALTTGSPAMTQNASQDLSTISDITKTPVPTAIPGLIPDPDAVVLAIETYTIENSGFSFDSLIGYKMEIFDHGVSINDPYSSVFILLIGFSDEPDYITNNDVISTLMKYLSEKFNTRFDKSKPYRIMIDGVEGLEYKITDDDGILIGQIFVIERETGNFLAGYCVSMNLIFPDRWNSEAKGKFEKLKSSIKFLP